MAEAGPSSPVGSDPRVSLVRQSSQGGRRGATRAAIVTYGLDMSTVSTRMSPEARSCLTKSSLSLSDDMNSAQSSSADIAEPRKSSMRPSSTSYQRMGVTASRSPFSPVLINTRSREDSIDTAHSVSKEPRSNRGKSIKKGVGKSSNRSANAGKSSKRSPDVTQRKSGDDGSVEDRSAQKSHPRRSSDANKHSPGKGSHASSDMGSVHLSSEPKSPVQSESVTSGLAGDRSSSSPAPKPRPQLRRQEALPSPVPNVRETMSFSGEEPSHPPAVIRSQSAPGPRETQRKPRHRFTKKKPEEVQERLSKMDEDLKAEIIADLKEAFSCSDRNGDGHICAKELTKVMRSMGMNPTESEIVEIMAKLDIDVNGVIELHEFIPLMLQRVQSMDTEEEIKKVFKVFDRDGNGFINETELRFMMNHVLKQEISDDDVDDLLKEADVDGDGRLNYDEFVRMLVNDLA